MSVSAAEGPDPDLEVLAKNVALSRLVADDLQLVYGYLDQMAVPSGTVVVHEDDPGDEMFFVLEGAARITRHGLELQAARPGDHFGELALLGFPRRAATVIAEGPLRVARLSRERYLKLSLEAPHVAIRLLEALFASVAHTLVTMTDNVSLLLGERQLPRRTEVTVTIGATTRTIATGTPARDLLPAEIDGDLVIACLLDSRAVSLRTPIVADARLEPLTVGMSDGREVFRRSAGLLLLEAARRVIPDVEVRLGPALDNAQLIELDLRGEPAQAVAARLRHVLELLIGQSAELREELWTVEEARAELTGRGWIDAAALLDTWRAATVPMVNAGDIYALRTEPVVLHAGVLAGIGVELIDGDGLVLTFGPRG